MAVKITDLVDPTAIEQLDKLNTTLSNTLVNFTEVAKQMAAQSIKIKIETTADSRQDAGNTYTEKQRGIRGGFQTQ